MTCERISRKLGFEASLTCTIWPDHNTQKSSEIFRQMLSNFGVRHDKVDSVPTYEPRCPGFDSQGYQIFLFGNFDVPEVKQLSCQLDEEWTAEVK